MLPAENLTIAPPRQITALMTVGMAALAGTAALADPAGQVLALPGALLLAVLIVRDLTLGPVLRADRDGLTVLSGRRQLQVPWADVVAMTVQTTRRTPVLDLDLGATVVVLGRGRLGRAPNEVLAHLRVLQAQAG